MDEFSIYQRLTKIEDLRDAVAEYGPVSLEVVRHVSWMLRPAMTCAELGLSPLSLQIALRAGQHSCIVPTEEAATALRAIAADTHVAADRFRILVGGNPEAAMSLAAGSCDLVVLSAPFAFPQFFAAMHQAARLLRQGGRLLVRGQGIWTVDTLRGFLRADPAWSSFQEMGPDAFTVTRQDAAAPKWRQQPYLVMNSRGDSLPQDKARAANHGHIQQFSSVMPALQARKAAARQPLNIGLVGYYGFGNYGDELFRLAFEQGLPEAQLPMLHDIPRRPYFIEPKSRKMDRIDMVVIGGGDLVIPGYWTDLYFEPEYLTRPVFLHGVGVPTWTGPHEGTVRRMREFFRHPNVKYINVRDEESRQWIQKHLEPHVPVHLTPDIVCGMDFGFAPPMPTAEKTFGLITRRTTRQSSKDDHLHKLLRRARDDGYRIRHIIAGNGPVGEEDFLDAESHGYDCDEVIYAETIEEITSAITGCSCLASMKFHGCVVAIMSGIPTLGLLATDKFVNFYRMLGIQDLVVPFTRANLPDAFGRLAEALPMERIAELRQVSQSGMAALRAEILKHRPGG